MPTKSVVVCASKRYAKEVAAFCDELESLGVTVFRPNISEPIFENEMHVTPHITRMLFKGLTLEHFDMIRKADACYVHNIDGYAGVSVSMEMGYATALGKPLYALNPTTGDPCRDSLIDRVTPTAALLAAQL